LRSEFSQRIAAAGIPTLLVTHDEEEARAMAVRGYRLAQGLLHPLW
jgi:ABC-type sulfate/molybdate transport systems ATPase subunit